MMKKSHRYLLMFAILALVILLSFVLDPYVIRFVSIIKTPMLDSFFSVLMFLEQGVIFYPAIAVISLALVYFTNKKKTLPYIISAVIAIMLSLLLKEIIARPRPDMLDDKSFPSGHSTMLFVLFPFLKTKAIKISWLVFSIILVSARIYTGLHYFSDIICAVVLSCAVSFIVNILFEKYHKKGGKKR